MALLARCDAPTFTLPGVHFTTLSAPSRGARENAVWEVTLEPGVAGSPHVLTREETFVALEGSAVAEIDGERCELAAGSALVVAPGRRFSLSNPGPASFRALAVFPVGGQVQVEGKPQFTPPWAA
jgi:mannose-6-phosphate isomerase-like protein (cupin superfamily)